MAKRPKLPRVDPEMQRWCAQIADELATWPGVTSRPMFGLVGYYRNGRIFAALPRTRAVETPFSLLVKLPNARRKRVMTDRVPGAGWRTIELQSTDDIVQALQQLARAYDTARVRTGRESRARKPRQGSKESRE